MTDKRYELTTGERLEKWVSDNGMYWVGVLVVASILAEFLLCLVG